MRWRCKCGPRATVWRLLAKKFTDDVQPMSCETLHASSNCFDDTRLRARTIPPISLTNASAVAGWPLLSLSVTLTRPFAKSQHHFRTCWTDITYAPYAATVYLQMLTGSVFGAHRNTICADAHFFTCVHSFSRIIIFQQTLRRRCTTDTGEDACRLAVGPSTSVWQNDRLFHKNKTGKVHFLVSHMAE